MNYKLIMSVAVFLGLSSSFAQVQVIDNFCIPRKDSKISLSNDFHSIYPRTVKFECSYECQVNGRREVITGAHSVKVRKMDDEAKLAICQGVKVKRVATGYDIAGIYPFYAYETKVKEIKAFAFDHIDRNNKTEKEMLQNLKTTLSSTATKFRAIGMAEFLDAAVILTKISNELPGNSNTLDRYVDLLVEYNGKVPKDGTPHSQVLGVLKTYADWRIPIHLYK